MQGLVLVLRLLLGELGRRLLERVGSSEHLPREGERRREHQDREDAQRRHRGRDEDGEQRQRHVRGEELAEHAAMHLTDDREQRFARLEVVVGRDEQGVQGVPNDGCQERRDDQLEGLTSIPRQHAEHIDSRRLDG